MGIRKFKSTGIRKELWERARELAKIKNTNSSGPYEWWTVERIVNEALLEKLVAEGV